MVGFINWEIQVHSRRMHAFVDTVGLGKGASAKMFVTLVKSDSSKIRRDQGLRVAHDLMESPTTIPKTSRLMETANLELPTLQVFSIHRTPATLERYIILTTSQRTAEQNPSRNDS